LGRRRDPLHGLVRLRARPQVLLHRAALAAGVLRPRHYYGFWDDPERFAFFSKAALEFLLRTGKRPDVIHTHDWHTGLVPVLL